jgi:hypothetical protein
MLAVNYHPLVQEEITASALYYEGQCEGLGTHFFGRRRQGHHGHSEKGNCVAVTGVSVSTAPIETFSVRNYLPGHGGSYPDSHSNEFAPASRLLAGA